MEANERAENLERQAEEAEALCSIYGDENFSPAGGLWEIRLPFSGDDDDDDDGAEGANRDLDPTGAIFAATTASRAWKDRTTLPRSVGTNC